MTKEERARQRSKDWYYANHEQNKLNRMLEARAFRRSHPEKRMLSGAKDRVRKSGLPLDITAEDIVIPTHCPILGVPLKIGGRHAPSLDRIDPDKGYVKGNIWVISRKANVMKNDATREELERFAQWVNQLTV